MLAWDALNELDAYRITEIPRRPEAGPAPPSPGQAAPAMAADPGRTQRLAALIAAYHAGADAKGDGSGAIALGWVRDSAAGPVHVLAAGAGLVGSDDGQDIFLTLPGGARARPLPRAGLTGLMARLPSWCAIGGISDGLLPGEEHRAGGRPPASLEECLLAVWPGPFGWLLIAEGLLGKLRAPLPFSAYLNAATGEPRQFFIFVGWTAAALAGAAVMIRRDMVSH